MTPREEGVIPGCFAPSRLVFIRVGRFAFFLLLRLLNLSATNDKDHTYPLLQVVNKKLDFDWVCDDPDVSELYARDKMDKESSFLRLVCSLHQLADITGTSIHDWMLPSGVCLRAVGGGELRMTRPNQESVLFDDSGLNPPHSCCTP